MNRVTLQEAQICLPELIASLQPGEEVQIMAGERVLARLVAELQTVLPPRKPGSAMGMLKILAEDEEHLEDFKDDMP